MSSGFAIPKRGPSRCAAFVVVSGFLAACVDETVAPAPDPADDGAGEVRVLGIAELTFSGIGTPDFASSLTMAPTMEALEQRRAERDRSGDLRDLVTQDLTIPADGNGGGDGTIQIAQPQRSQFVLDGARRSRLRYCEPGRQQHLGGLRPDAVSALEHIAGPGPIALAPGRCRRDIKASRTRTVGLSVRLPESVARHRSIKTEIAPLLAAWSAAGIDALLWKGLPPRRVCPGFESVPAARAALAYRRSVDGIQTGRVYHVWS